jgi:predicted GIY-YIG superfamily endonuclease
MSVDQYQESFEHMVEQDFPQLLSLLESAAKNPISMNQFNIEGVGPATICSRLGLDEDFAGCYVLSEKDQPVYVGISRQVIARLRQHAYGNTHFDASLAYRIAAKSSPHKLTRDKAMESLAFKESFIDAKAYIGSLNSSFVEIGNPLVRYVFEPYCALHFGTAEWNTFETH